VVCSGLNFSPFFSRPARYHGDFSRLLDLVRLTIACTEVKYVTLLIDGIHTDPKLKILRIKNRLDPAAVCASSAG
jgi:hypothetical protein